MLTLQEGQVLQQQGTLEPPQAGLRGDEQVKLGLAQLARRPKLDATHTELEQLRSTEFELRAKISELEGLKSVRDSSEMMRLLQEQNARMPDYETAQMRLYAIVLLAVAVAAVCITVLNCSTLQ
jgi:hypothetical protein